MTSPTRSTRIILAADTSRVRYTRRQPRLSPRAIRRFVISATALFCLMPVGYVHAAVVNYSYDALGRLTKADYSGDMTATITSEYDETGNWTLVTATRTTP